MGRTYSPDLTFLFLSSFLQRLAKEVVLDACLERKLTLYIPRPKMSQTVKHYWPPCQLQFNNAKDSGSLSKLIRCPRKVGKKGDKSDIKKMVLWEIMESRWEWNFAPCAFAPTSIFYSQLFFGALLYLLEKTYNEVILHNKGHLLIACVTKVTYFPFLLKVKLIYSSVTESSVLLLNDDWALNGCQVVAIAWR